MKGELDNLDVMYRDTKHEVQKYEEVVEQLTAELRTTQDELSMSNNRVRECEENVKNLKDRNGLLQSEVSYSTDCVDFFGTFKFWKCFLL